MPLSKFDGARLKLLRAAAHMGELVQLVDAHLQTGPLALESREDPSDTSKELVTIVQKQPLVNLSLILGDAIHNMRSSLDLLAYDLVAVEQGASVEKASFPFAKSADRLGAEIKNRAFDKASAEARDLLRSIDPTADGAGAVLHNLHMLDIVQKHRLIPPIFSRGRAREIVVRSPEGGGEWLYDVNFGPVYPTWRFTKGGTVQLGQIEMDLLFGQDAPEASRGKNVVSTMRVAYTAVENTIARFAGLYPDIKSGIQWKDDDGNPTAPADGPAYS